MLSQLLVFRKSKNFTSDNEILMPPTVPLNHYFGLRNQQNKTKVIFHYSMLMYSGLACLKHSNFLKVNSLSRPPASECREVVTEGCEGAAAHARRRTLAPSQKSNYELFNCNNINICYWSWNYRGCWHQTCPPIGPR